MARAASHDEEKRVLKLTYVVVNDGSQSILSISGDCDASKLREAIKNQEQYLFPASILTLFVSNKSVNTWLMLTTEEIDQIEGGSLLAKVSAMLTTERRMRLGDPLKSYGFQIQ